MRHLQRDHMGKFMPDDLLPVDGTTRFQGPWRVEGNDMPETDTQKMADIWQPESSHRKVFMIREYLNENRSLGRKIIFGREGIPTLQ